MLAEAKGSGWRRQAAGGRNWLLKRVGAEPLNSAPGAEEGSLTSVQGSDEIDLAGAYLNPA